MSQETEQDRSMAEHSQLEMQIKRLSPDLRLNLLKTLIAGESDENLDTLSTIISTEIASRRETMTATPIHIDEPKKPKSEKVETDRSSLQLSEIDKSITGRYVHGKFSGRVVLHGQEVLPASYNSQLGEDYTFAPKVERKIIDPTSQFTALNELIRKAVHNPQGSGVTELQRQLALGHSLAYYKDAADPSLAHLQLIYPYLFRDAHGRPALTLNTYFNLPSTQLEHLLRIIKENPDAAERFYQLATDGLDESTQRYKSTQLAVVDAEKFMPVLQFQNPNTFFHQMVAAYPNRLNQQGIQLLEYSQPFGKVQR